MPLTALLADVGRLDATIPDLGAGRPWETVYKARPRVALTCPGCGSSLHAKVSPAPRRARYFAHDAARSDCLFNGESLAHRLLKTELASAIRSADWIAELEVSGDGWRTDVLAVSPDGARRVAWEAQLKRLTEVEVRDRTESLGASGLEVCWVVDVDPPWLGQVPSVRIRSSDEAPAGLVIANNVLRFEDSWCPRRRCDDYPGPCTGHGEWVVPAGLTLATFVAAVCANTSVLHTISAPRLMEPRHTTSGTLAWTARCYIELERRQLAAEERQQQDRRDHEASILALLARQEALIEPAIDLVYRRTGVKPRVDAGGRDARWAKGVPLFIDHKPYAVIAPVAGRIAPLRGVLRGLVLIVATEQERRSVSRAAAPGQEVLIVRPS